MFRVRDLEGDGGEIRALKRLKDDRRVGRIENEMAALQRVKHPNVVELIDYHVSGKPPYYLVTEWLDGGTLSDCVQAYKGDIVRSLELFLSICDGVYAAHVADVIHRDLKPDNILFRTLSGEPVVTDFGLCWVYGDERFTASQEHVGAFRYMAPELEDGRLDRPTPQCDVYSLGKVLYYIVSGGTEFNREKHRDPQYDLRRRFAGCLSPVQTTQMEYISELLDHMIAYDPSHRYPSVFDARAALETVRKLVTDGQYPFTDHMPCKFCGQGTYKRHQRGRGNFAQNLLTYDHSNISVAILVCTNCGHLQFFDSDAFQRDPKRAELQ